MTKKNYCIIIFVVGLMHNQLGKKIYHQARPVNFLAGLSFMFHVKQYISSYSQIVN